MDIMYVTSLRRTLTFSHYSDALVAISNGILAVKLCSIEILHFLTECVRPTAVELYDGHNCVCNVIAHKLSD